MKTVSGQLNVREALALLDALPQDVRIQFATGIYPGSLDSFRGWYEDLAVGIATPIAAPTVRTFASSLRAKIGTIITGYKGGDYLVTPDTALWVAQWGDCGPALVGFRLSKSGRYVKILTRVDD